MASSGPDWLLLVDDWYANLKTACSVNPVGGGGAGGGVGGAAMAVVLGPNTCTCIK